MGRTRPRKGYHLHTVELLDERSENIASFPWIGTHSAASLPNLASFASLRDAVTRAAEALKSATAEREVREVCTPLASALAINPRDAQALRLGADVYVRLQQHGTAAELLNNLSEILPADGRLLAELGHHEYASGNFEAANKALMRSVELKAASAVGLEELARIRLAQGDVAASVKFADESLHLMPQNQALWLMRADLAAKMKDWQRQAESYERALAQGGPLVAQRAALIRLYLDHGNEAEAIRHIEIGVPVLPKNAEAHAQWAEFLERVGRQDQALNQWTTARELDSAREDVHYAIARLALEKKDYKGALAAAGQGLEVAPRSARLYLAKAAALEKEGEVYSAGRTLKQATASVEDGKLLARAAELADQFGTDASASYRRAIVALEKTKDAGRQERLLEQGMLAAIRDRHESDVKWFRARLEAMHSPMATLGISQERKGSTGVLIPGGLKALAFVAHSKPDGGPDRFLVDYARAVIGAHYSKPLLSGR